MSYSFREFEEAVQKKFFSLGLLVSIEEHSDCFWAVPETTNLGHRRPDFFDGMALRWYKADQHFEVVEHGAGESGTELWVYTKTRYPETALRSLTEGNKRTPIEVWK